MKKLILFTGLAILLFNAKAQNNFSDEFKQINTEVQSNSQAYQNLKTATEKIGHRLTGSANGAKAEEFAYNLFKSYGYEVRYQPFEVESWDRKTLSVKVGSDKNALTTVKAVTLAHSPVKADVTAEIIDVGMVWSPIINH